MLRISGNRITVTVPEIPFSAITLCVHSSNRIVFLYLQCHLSWIPTYAGMKEKSNSPRLIATVLVSFLICCITYTSVTFLGVLTFGSNLNSDLMKNYDANQAVVLVGIAAVAFKTITTYPLLLYCARVAICDYYNLINPSNSVNSNDNRTSRSIIIISWFSTSLAVAILVPNIGVAIECLGCLAIVFIFVVPGACLISASQMKHPGMFLVKDKLFCAIGAVYIMLGTFLFGLTVTQAAMKDFFSSGTASTEIPLCS